MHSVMCACAAFGGRRPSSHLLPTQPLYNWGTGIIRQCDYLSSLAQSKMTFLELNILWTFWTVQSTCVSYISLYVLIFDGESESHTCRSSMLTYLTSPMPTININSGKNVTWQAWHGKNMDFWVRKTSVQIPTGSHLISGIFSKFFLSEPLLCWLQWQFYRCLGMFKLIKLYSLNICSSLHINYTSINLFKK